MGLAALSCFSEAADASAWPREKGSIFITSGSDIFRAVGDFTFDPPPLEDSTEDVFQRIQTNSYIEYGLTDKWTVSLKGSYGFFTVSSPNAVVTSDGLTEIEGFIQRQVWRSKKSVLSLGVGAGRINTLGAEGVLGFQSDGIDTELRALYGRTLTQTPFEIFTSAELAYRRRFGIAADQVRADAKIGFKPHERLLVLVDTFSLVSLRNNGIAENGAVGADFDVVKIEPAVAIRVYKNLRFHGGVNYEIANRGFSRGRTFFFNLWSEF